MLDPILNYPFFPLFRDSIWGISYLTIILIFHGTAINHVYMHFENLTRNNLKLGQYNRVFFHFYVTFVLIAMIHILEILFWSIFLLRLDLIDKPIDALIFAGSCYTTVGFAADTLREGWKSLAFFISFSGLFSLAWTTSIMIGMTGAYKSAWNQKYGRTTSEDEK